MEYHLDITDALKSLGLGADITPYVGETVYRLQWQDGSGRREGFASANSANSALRLLRAHEVGYGRTVTDAKAVRWGTPARLADWARSRCSS